MATGGLRGTPGSQEALGYECAQGSRAAEGRMRGTGLEPTGARKRAGQLRQGHGLRGLRRESSYRGDWGERGPRPLPTATRRGGRNAHPRAAAAPRGSSGSRGGLRCVSGVPTRLPSALREGDLCSFLVKSTGHITRKGSGHSLRSSDSAVQSEARPSQEEGDRGAGGTPSWQPGPVPPGARRDGQRGPLFAPWGGGRMGPSGSQRAGFRW